ncbi:DNA glycosylase AlkZ-like family protein [Paludibaculum fermentans]|uniref:DNA glycosylase AlkZ-like family protein n=1 Tax=Paludibaculum fermentans TaxID=1473598 RepID=UPI003EBD0E1F
MKSPLNEKLRAWWSHRQALDGRMANAAPADVLAQTGWARSVAGVGPYLTLLSRAGTSREAADKAVTQLEIHELPCARGCTYIVPAADFAFALKAGASFGGAELKTAAKLGVTEKEVDKLCAAVVDALAKGPMEPDEIRAATGNASRSLGEEGKKKGLTTTLPLALGQLQTTGDIRRIPTNGRLDQQRYRYTLWRPNPLAKSKMTPEELHIELARRYFQWIGPATQAELQWFTALNGRDTKASLAALKLEKSEDDKLILAEDRDAFEAFQVPKQAHYVLTSSIDGLSLLRRDLQSLLDPADAAHPLLQSTSRGGLLMELPSHAIFDRGRLVGLWEYDPSTESIAWSSFIPKNKDLEKAVTSTEEYVRTQLGDARSFSLDSPKSRVPRIEALRQASR